MTSMLLCLSCGVVTNQDLDYSPALVRMKEWQDRLATFWGQHPYLFYLMKAAPLWLAIAVVMAYFEYTREYTVIFVSLALLTSISREVFPLTPVPFNVYNVVTSRADFYSTAARVLIVSFVGLVFVGGFIYLSEQLGNVYAHVKTDFSGESPPSYWSKEMLPWLTVIIIVFPMLYFGSLVISNSFVSAYMQKLGSRNI